MEGLDVVSKIEKTATDVSDRPEVDVIIKESGEVPTPTPVYITEAE